MKLAFCLFNYFPYGGLQRDFIRIAAECLRRGHTIEVYTMQWEGPNELNLPITFIQPKAWQNHTRMRAFAENVQHHLQAKNYDRVLGFNKMPGLDLYYAADTCYQAKAHKKHGLLYRLLPRYKQLCAFEQAVFTPQATAQILLLSALQQKDFIDYYHTPLSRFHFLPPGIAKDRIAPDNFNALRTAWRDKHNIPSDTLLLLMIGSGFKTKGLDRILQGIADLPHTLKKRVQLNIIGKDHAKSFIAQAKKLSILNHVNFLGGRDDVPQWLLAGDLLLHPAYNENTGTVLLEAIASGLPVLTTDVCGYAHYILDANAGKVLPSPFHQADFNQTLQDMLLSPQRENWRQNGIHFAKTADIYSLPSRAADILEQLGH